MNASNPAYRRAFSTQQHNSTEYFWTRHVKPELLALIGSDLPPAEDGTPKLPPALKFRGQQIGRAMSRASQAAKRVQEIERYIKARTRELADRHNKRLPLAFVMTDSEFSRWSFCLEMSARADVVADRLLKSLREELQSLRNSDPPDLVAQMAQAEEPPADDPPDEEPPPPPIKEPGPEPPPAKSGESED